jgi:hypothetical protein
MKKEDLMELVEDEMGCANNCPMKDKGNYEIDFCGCYKAKVIREIEELYRYIDKGNNPPTIEPESLPRKEVISIQPGDVVVLTNPEIVSMEQQDLAETDLKRMFPDNESLFLSGGVTFEVYREQQEWRIDRIFSIDPLRLHFQVTCPLNTDHEDIVKHSDIPSLFDTHPTKDGMCAMDIDIPLVNEHKGMCVATVIVTYREQEKV